MVSENSQSTANHLPKYSSSRQDGYNNGGSQKFQFDTMQQKMELNRASSSANEKAVQLGSRERLIAFCEVVQRSCLIGSFIRPTAGVTPGYALEVIFADGTFIDGSTSELSCDDGPLNNILSGRNTLESLGTCPGRSSKSNMMVVTKNSFVATLMELSLECN